MRVALVGVLAASLLTGVGSVAGPAGATTPCASARGTLAAGHWKSGSISASRRSEMLRLRSPSSGWALIKLGGLTGDLRLNLYDRSCHLVATSQHRGRHFEQVYRRLPAGRYYVRVSGVSGVSGATSRYAVQFRPLRDGVRFLSAHAYEVPGTTGLLEVDGEVLNNLSRPNFFRWAVVRFFDRAGHVVARTDTSFQQQYVRARSRSAFTAQLPTPKKRWVRYTVTTVTQALQGYPPPPRTKIVPAAPKRDAAGNLHYPGRFTNESKKTILLGGVVATAYNTYGNVDYVDIAAVTPGTLRPGRTGYFDAEFLDPVGINSVEIR